MKSLSPIGHVPPTGVSVGLASGDVREQYGHDGKALSSGLPHCEQRPVSGLAAGQHARAEKSKSDQSVPRLLVTLGPRLQ